MKAVGVVAEYNPFHNGHHYHINRAKEISRADIVVAVMSGNFTQRGEPTILDKWHRAQEALANGVDLVVELPLAFSVQPAHLFASGAITMMTELGIQSMVFGAEHAEWDFDKLVRAESKFKSNQFDRYNATYATVFNEQLQEATGVQLTEPNDILAFGYFKARYEQAALLDLIPIRRLGTHYHDLQINEQRQIASASAIRESVKDRRNNYQTVVPQRTINDLAELNGVADWNELYPYLRYQLIQAPIKTLGTIYQMAEGLEFRMKAVAETAENFDEFIHEVKTKRYTYSRLIRVCLYVLLQITDAEMKAHFESPYIRILGFNLHGQTYLHEIKKQATVPIVARMNRELKNGLANLDYRAGKMYEQLNRTELQDMRRQPIIQD